MLVFAAVLPQFLVDGPTPTWVQVTALGVLDVALGLVVWAVVVHSACACPRPGAAPGCGSGGTG